MNKFEAILGDTIANHQLRATDSVHMYMFSPPFAELYVYSDKVEDMGNVRNYDEFFTHFDYLLPEIQRCLLPGRHVVIHCMDLPIQKGKEGYIGTRDFPGMIVQAFQKHGFIFHDRVVIWKNPVTEMQRTKALGLLHKQVKKDAIMSRTGIADQLIIMRNAGDNPTPIIHQDTDPSKPDYLPVDLWQRYASPVWDDINYSQTLQFRSAKDQNDEKHICPLQIETIERALHLWSNEGETICDPFGGIGTTAWTALKHKRNAVTDELKESYYQQMQKNLAYAQKEFSKVSLFDLMEVE